MTATTIHELKGLEPDNLLAFLALLGLLRSLETAKPEWQPRAAWRDSPISAKLEIRSAATSQEIAAEANTGVKLIGKAYSAALGGRRDLKFAPADFRDLARNTRTHPIESRIVGTLASDGALRKNGKEVIPTAFCVMFGSGHQHFLERLQRVPCEGTADDVRSALFDTWQYEDRTDSFRWDPIEDRRYAHQFGAPREFKNKIGTVAGANRLAAVGFGTLVSAPAADGLTTLGIVDSEREKYACWPLPAVPTSLTAYLALLAHPMMGSAEKSIELIRYGVVAVARARRFQIDKYFNFARARIQFLQ